MTWLEILWACFWRSLLWRQHERPTRWRANYENAGTSRLRAPMGENRDEKAVVLVDRHGAGCLRVSRRLVPISKTAKAIRA